MSTLFGIGLVFLVWVSGVMFGFYFAELKKEEEEKKEKKIWNK